MGAAKEMKGSKVGDRKAFKNKSRKHRAYDAIFLYWLVIKLWYMEESRFRSDVDYLKVVSARRNVRVAPVAQLRPSCPQL